MRKKINILAFALVCLLFFGACSSASTKFGNYSQQDIQSVIQQTADQLQSLSASEASRYEAYYKQNQTETNAKVYAEMFANWAENRDQAGEFVGYGSFEVSRSGKTLTATQIMDFSQRDLRLTYVMNAKSMEVTSINIEPVYSLGETMSKAGLNVIMGMGTVFAMLILISLLIGCFKYIPGAGQAKKKAESAPRETMSPAPAPVAEEDDRELVAVISAAIAAATGSRTDDFVVRSIKRRY